MRGFIVALALISACAAVSRDAQWEEFKLTFKKGYRNLDQESERKGIFMAHLDAIEAHNAKFEAGLSTYKQGINQFSDLTFEEFENTVLMREQSYVQVRNIVLLYFRLQEEFVKIYNPILPKILYLYGQSRALFRKLGFEVK